MSTLAEIEVSSELSRPIELYQFSIGSDTYRRTSAEGTVTFNGSDFDPIPIKRTGWQDSREQRNTNITITLPTSDEIAQVYLGIQPSALMNITVLRIQPNAVPTTASLVMFEGYVASTLFKNERCELRCVPNNEFATRTMPRFSYQGLCNHVLYDSQCMVSEGSYKHSGTVLGVTNDVEVQVQSLPTSGSPFIGGYLQIPDGSEQRLIIAQSGTTVTILYPFKQTISGGTIDAYQGCDHTPVTCSQKFANIINFGGFPFVPAVNPFNKQQLTKE